MVFELAIVPALAGLGLGLEYLFAKEGDPVAPLAASPSAEIDAPVPDMGPGPVTGMGEHSPLIATLWSEGQETQVLLDFDESEELFSVVYLDTPPQDQSVTFTAEDDGLRACVSGQEIALLRNMGAEDIPHIQTFVSTASALAAPAS